MHLGGANMLVRLDDNFIVNLNAVESVRITRNSFGHYVLMSFNEGTHEWSFINKEDAQRKFDEIDKIISTAINIKLNEHGAFLCSHCGAPNS